MESGPHSRRAGRRAVVVAGSYFAFAACCVVYAWVSPGMYSLNFLIPYLVTAPTSLLAVWLVTALGLEGSPALAAIGLTAAAGFQAAVLYAFVYLSGGGRTGRRSDTRAQP